MSRGDGRRHGVGRGLSDTVCLPVDASTRAFRRACSEPRFPFDKVERDSVVLRDVPIQFRWGSKSGDGETLSPEMEKPSSSTARNSPASGFDPHRTGFGPIPSHPQMTRLPPIHPNRVGLLGPQPLKSCGQDLEDDNLAENFPILIQIGGGDPHHPNTPSPPPSQLGPKPRFANLSRFLGYFRSKSISHPLPRSYSQVVQTKFPTTMVYPIQNRGGGRDGRGAGRQGRGQGRTGGRDFVWQRSEENRRADAQGGSDSLRDASKEEGEIEERGGSEAWDQAANRQQVHDISNLEHEVESDRNFEKKNTHIPESSKNSAGWKDGKGEYGCRFCGLKNHRSEDCLRKTQCENCGFNNHSTAECRREPLSSFGPELCAAQVEDQSFFFIEEIKDSKASIEKASTAIISVISGSVTSKQIEEEFRHTDVSRVWRWSARKLAENKYSLRFPDAKLVQVYSNFKCLGMKTADAQIKVDPWSSAASAKGELQQAWFRVKGIPSDQRAIKTIAKVGGLVGKTVAIDEKSRFRSDYVRVKIACRDASLVPSSAEGTLGMMIYDFFFEREVTDEIDKEAIKIGVKDDALPNQHISIKLKMGDSHPVKADDPGTGQGGGGDKYTYTAPYTKYAELQSSAPAKLLGKTPCDKNCVIRKENKEEISWDESEDTDEFSLGINGEGDVESHEVDSSGAYSNVRLFQCESNSKVTSSLLMAKRNGNTPTLGVTITELTQEEEKLYEQTKTVVGMDDMKISESSKYMTENPVIDSDILEEELHVEQKELPRMERRTSARLEKDIALTIEEKNQRLAKKRNLEGTNLIPEHSISTMSENDIVHLSKDMGVDLVNDASFIAIDLIKDLEIARHALAEKNLNTNVSNVEEATTFEEIMEEISETDSLPLQPRNRKGKPRNRLSLSGPRKTKKGRGNPSSKTSKEGDQGNLDQPLEEKKGKGKKKS